MVRMIQFLMKKYIFIFLASILSLGAVNYNEYNEYIYEDEFKTLYNKHRSIDFQDRNGLTLLHRAVMSENSNNFNWLIEKQANPLIQDKEGNTPLHLAVLFRETYMLNQLGDIEKGFYIQNNKGETPILLMAKKNIVDAIYCIERYKIDTSRDEELDMLVTQYKRTRYIKNFSIWFIPALFLLVSLFFREKRYAHQLEKNPLGPINCGIAAGILLSLIGTITVYILAEIFMEVTHSSGFLIAFSFLGISIVTGIIGLVFGLSKGVVIFRKTSYSRIPYYGAPLLVGLVAMLLQLFLFE